MKISKLWTKGEDEILAKAVNDHMIKGVSGWSIDHSALENVTNSISWPTDSDRSLDWAAIATRLLDRTNKDCRKRWTCCLAPTIKKGQWSDIEDSLLTEATKVHGMKWSLVSRHLGSRQPDQCSRRWHEVIKPDIDRTRWSLYEDHILANAVRAHGRRWTEIVERYFPKRTPISCRKRYKQLMKVREFRKSLPG